MAEENSVVDKEEKSKLLPALTKEELSKNEWNTAETNKKPIDQHLTISTTTTINHGSHKSKHFGELTLSTTTSMNAKYNLLKPAINYTDISKSKVPVSNGDLNCNVTNNNNINKNNHSGEIKRKKKKRDKTESDRLHNKDRDDVKIKNKALSNEMNGTNKSSPISSKNSVFSLKNFVKHHEGSSTTEDSLKKKNKDRKTHDKHNHESTNHGAKRKSEVSSDGMTIKKVKQHHIKAEKINSPTEKVKKTVTPSRNQFFLEFEKLPLKKTVERSIESKEKHKINLKSPKGFKEEVSTPLKLESPVKKDHKERKKSVVKIESGKATAETHKIKHKSTGLLGKIFKQKISLPSPK